jgi:argininosuccinate lyase
MALWGGRFGQETHELMQRFSSSVDVDARLWDVDIRVSMAHARMLGAQGILSPRDAQSVLTGLKEIHEEIREGRWTFSENAEDIHGEIESYLFQKIGEPAKRLHTARSRNDQVATDTRLYLKENVDLLMADLECLQKALLSVAEHHVDTVLPGMTHLQHAQPVSLAHHLMAYFWMFERDRQRLRESGPRILSMPLGSAALAGTGFPLDRRMTAGELGFHEVAPNSLDAVSDRDFVLEFLSHASIGMMHLSRLCEELILWSTPEFAFVELSDAVTTGSSIMPQKKNPDAAELIRGRVGRVYGALMGALTMMKALPLSYNRDMQEDKIHLFSAMDTYRTSVSLMTLMIESAEWKVKAMAAALAGDFSNATDLADDLAVKGVSFREAHEIVGRLVRQCLSEGRALEQLTLAELRVFHPEFDESSLQKLSHMAVMEARQSEGGTASAPVLKQIEKAKSFL